MKIMLRLRVAKAVATSSNSKPWTRRSWFKKGQSQRRGAIPLRFWRESGEMYVLKKSQQGNKHIVSLSIIRSWNIIQNVGSGWYCTCYWIYYICKCRLFLYSHCHIFKTIQLPISINMTCMKIISASWTRHGIFFLQLFNFIFAFSPFPECFMKNFLRYYTLLKKKNPKTFLIYITHLALCIPGTCFRGIYHKQRIIQ